MSDISHILVIDDEKNYLIVMEALLKDAGYEVTALNDPEMALHFLDESEVDVVITDMKMPKLSGKEVLQRIKKSWPDLPVLIMTAFGSIESAVEAMRYGAFDYITKPFANDELLLSVHNAVELSKAHRQYKLLQESLEERYRTHHIIGKSKAIRNTLSIVDRVAVSRSTVLITGESGTGKELVARAIHFSSPRKEGPFVSVNCMAFNSGVLESELFGHEKGSFTGAVATRRGRFEQADHGTLFLDELADMTLPNQAKLLRVLEEREVLRVGSSKPVSVDIKLIAATNVNLEEAVRKGKFREDLYYRINVAEIRIPPLRDRGDDILLLAQLFLERHCAYMGRPRLSLSPAVCRQLLQYGWPGNVRELNNEMERAASLTIGNRVELSDLSTRIVPEEARCRLLGTEPLTSREGAAAPKAKMPIVQNYNLQEMERKLILEALDKTDGNKSKAAELLGITREGLRKKLLRMDISDKEIPHDSGRA